MKRKIVVVLLALALTVTPAGCNKVASSNDQSTESVETLSTEGTVEEQTEGQAEETAKQETPAEENVDFTQNAGYVTTGGTPWLNSDLKENVTADMETSLKDDFHLYVNRDWIAKNELPVGYSRWDNFGAVSEEVKQRCIDILNDDSLTGHDAELLHSYYHAILDWDSRNAAGVTPIMPTVEDIQGIKTLDELSDFICDTDRSMYVASFVKFGNGPDLADSTKYVLYLMTDSLILGDSAEYKARTEQGERIYAAEQYLATYILGRLGYSEEEAKKMLDTTLEFEKKLAEVSLTKSEQMSPDYISKIYNLYTKDQVSEMMGNFPLMRLIENAGYGEAKEYLIYQPKLINAIDEIYTEENLENIKNYMLVKFALGMVSDLDQEAYEAQNKFSNMLSGIEGSVSYEEDAFADTESSLNTPMCRAYLEKYDCSEMRERITGICEDIIAEYREMLKEEDWLSEETRNKAIEKLDAIKVNALYPDEWRDYSKMDLKGKSYLECAKTITEFALDVDRARVNGVVNKDEWTTDPLTPNAYYLATNNSINILIGTMGGVFYYDGMSDEELYAGIGAIIGHEISHAFDTNGSQFDKDGNLAVWWTEEDYATFQARAQKLIDYYNNITAWEGMPVNGVAVQTEAIADMAGLKVMLRMAEKKENFDYEKFFKAYAILWRAFNTYETEYAINVGDSHPLNYLRTNVTLQQFEKFFETFDIKEGDGMYLAPEDNVLVW